MRPTRALAEPELSPILPVILLSHRALPVNKYMSRTSSRSAVPPFPISFMNSSMSSGKWLPETLEMVPDAAVDDKVTQLMTVSTMLAIADGIGRLALHLPV